MTIPKCEEFVNAKAECPACGQFSIDYATVCDDKHDEIYEVAEYCLDENCGYERAL